MGLPGIGRDEARLARQESEGLGRVDLLTQALARANLVGRGSVVIERYEGTPQGGPLSPLRANVLLDEVDRGLERRGHLSSHPRHLP